MELPALEVLRSTLPRARITALANPPAHELLEEDPRVDEVVVASRWGLRHRWDEADASTREEIAAWVRARAFDLVLDASQATVAVGEAIWSLGIRSLESDAREESAAIEAGGSGVEAIRAGVRRGWGVDVPRHLEPRLHIRARDRARAQAVLERAGAAGEPPIAIAPVSSSPLKAWPVRRFAAVADHVAARGGRILILEGPQADKGQELRESMRRPAAAVRVGSLHLLATAALLERSRMLVCNDTGLMHMAAAVGTLTVAAFGPTHEDIFLPPSDSSVAVTPRELACAYRETRSLHPPECWARGRCLIAEHSCVLRTPVEDVVRAVDELLDGKRRGAALHRAPV